MIFVLVLGILIGLYGHIAYRQWRDDVLRREYREAWPDDH